jgi:hypothetical protein
VPRQRDLRRAPPPYTSREISGLATTFGELRNVDADGIFMYGALAGRQYARMICIYAAETLCAMPRVLVSAWLEDIDQCLAASIDGVFDVVSLYGFVQTAVHIGRGEWNAWRRIWKVTLESFRRGGNFGDMV